MKARIKSNIYGIIYVLVISALFWKVILPKAYAQTSQNAFSSLVVELARDHQAQKLQRQKERLLWYKMNQTSAPTINYGGYRMRQPSTYCGIKPRLDGFGNIVAYERVCQ